MRGSNFFSSNDPGQESNSCLPKVSKYVGRNEQCLGLYWFLPVLTGLDIRSLPPYHQKEVERRCESLVVIDREKQQKQDKKRAEAERQTQLEMVQAVCGPCLQFGNAIIFSTGCQKGH